MVSSFVEIKLNKVCYDSFGVLDDDNPVTGLADGDFTKKLFNPNGIDVSGSIIVTITELGSGLYKSAFTPNLEGHWLLVIYNTTYFPWGKAQNYFCREYEIDDIYSDMATVNELDTQTQILLAFIKNKKLLRKEGAIWYIVVRNATDTADILKKELKDKSGGDITDFQAGIMTQELATSV